MVRRLNIDAFYVTLWALMTAKMLLARQMMLGHFAGVGALSDITVITACVLFCMAVGGTTGRRMLTASAVVISLLAIGSVVYTASFEHVPGVQNLVLSEQLGSLNDGTMSNLWSWSYLLFVIDLPFVVYFGLRKEHKHLNPSARFGVAAAVALVLPLLFSTSASATRGMTDSRQQSYRMGVVAYQFSSLFGEDEKSITAAEDAGDLQEQIDELTGHSAKAPRKPGAPSKGALKGKNLIVIQVEALQAAVVQKHYAGRAITPSLNALIEESTYFPNAYSQIGRGNTSDAEFIANTSLYPAMESPSSLAYAKKELPALPRLLAEAGYRTMTFHANDVTFWNRQQLYPALGFEEVCDRAFFQDEDKLGYGSSDYILFKKALPLLLTAKSEETPFYANFVTVSSHYPFKDAAARGTIPLSPEMAASQTGRYIQAQNYADQQIGYFIEELRRYGLLEDTIVVVYGDHFGLRFDNDEQIDREMRAQLVGHEYNRADYYNIPLIMRIPGVTPSEDHSVLGQIDIMPSICDLLGIDIDDTPHFGRSAFEHEKTLLTRASSIPTYITDEAMLLQGVTNGEDRWYDPTTQRMLAPRPYPGNIENASQLIELSASYAQSLPERSGATDDVGHIPATAFDNKDTPFR